MPLQCLGNLFFEVLQVVGTLDGKILLDATNPLIANRLDSAVELRKSGSEQVATWFTGARVVKIFNTIGWEVMDNPQFGSESATLFYAGDDAEAKQIAADKKRK